jgi:hypothetical protein
MTIYLTKRTASQPIMILLDYRKSIKQLSSYFKSTMRLKKLGLERNTVSATRLGKACMLRYFNAF